MSQKVQTVTYVSPECSNQQQRENLEQRELQDMYQTAESERDTNVTEKTVIIDTEIDDEDQYMNRYNEVSEMTVTTLQSENAEASPVILIKDRYVIEIDLDPAKWPKIDDSVRNLFVDKLPPQNMDGNVDVSKSLRIFDGEKTFHHQKCI